MLAPQDLVGIPFSYNGNPAFAAIFQYANTPVIGGWYGTTQNVERFLEENPQIILDGTDSTNATLDAMQQQFGTVPVVGCNAGDYLTQYTPEIQFIGNILGVQTQAQSLINFYQTAMNYVTQKVYNIQMNNRVTVYYAEGSAGLNTDPAGSMHTMLVSFCGGINVANVTLLPGYGMATTSLDAIYNGTRKLIIVGTAVDSTLYNTIMKQRTMAATQCRFRTVKSTSGLIILGHGMTNHPVQVRLLGMYWMVHTFYPSLTTDLNLSH